ncbi:hypothetical protein HN698_00125 [Candidatus Woesearchaeota archaeon]|jgi:hypothetical protein|nr:hypothetical protein [Candidatus Woesearchaeota archaeon]MBT4698168.1 hypothetical protein [Candidatus Woesearchaeota archaeon]MBT4716351.1 hypothetical protein [Candidatus Woesearchaeota archaeon]MBT7930307.1 hypothetical protein [Candidatus Woesearchaeota archaeon]
MYGKLSFIAIVIMLFCIGCGSTANINETTNETNTSSLETTELETQPIIAGQYNDNGIEFTYPEDWEVNLSVSSRILFFAHDPTTEDKFDEALIVSRYSNKKDHTVWSIQNKVEEDLEFMNGFQKREFATLDHYAIRFSYKDELADKYRLSKRLYIISEDYYYTVEFLTDSDSYDDYLHGFKNIAKTIKIENTTLNITELFDGPDLHEYQIPEKPVKEIEYEESDDPTQPPKPKYTNKDFIQKDENILYDFNGRITDKDQEDLHSFTVKEPGYVLTETAYWGKGTGRLTTEIYQFLSDPPVDWDYAEDDDSFSENIKYDPGKYIVKVRPYTDADLGVYTFKAKWCEDKCQLTGQSTS